MKFALVLYGKRRDILKCEPSWQAFKNKYNPDIFYHTWGDIHVEGILNGTSTKSMMITQDLDFTHLHNGIDQYASSALNVLPQTYSMKMADQLRVAYEQTMGFKYDWVMRSRFDIYFYAPESLDFNTLNPNDLYVCGNHWPGNTGMYDDNVMVGNSFEMAVNSRELFSFAIAQINEHKVIPSGEQLLAVFFRSAGKTNIHKIDPLNFTLGRNL